MLRKQMNREKPSYIMFAADLEKLQELNRDITIIINFGSPKKSPIFQAAGNGISKFFSASPLKDGGSSPSGSARFNAQGKGNMD